MGVSESSSQRRLLAVEVSDADSKRLLMVFSHKQVHMHHSTCKLGRAGIVLQDVGSQMCVEMLICILALSDW